MNLTHTELIAYSLFLILEDLNGELSDTEYNGIISLFYELSERND